MPIVSYIVTKDDLEIGDGGYVYVKYLSEFSKEFSDLTEAREYLNEFNPDLYKIYELECGHAVRIIT